MGSVRLCTARSCPQRIRVHLSGKESHYELCGQCQKLFPVGVGSANSQGWKRKGLLSGGILLLSSLVVFLIYANDKPQNINQDEKIASVDLNHQTLIGKFDCYTCQHPDCMSKTIHITAIDSSEKVSWEMPAFGQKGRNLRGTLVKKGQSAFFKLETTLLNQDDSVNVFEAIQMDGDLSLIHQGLSECRFKKRKIY